MSTLPSKKEVLQEVAMRALAAGPTITLTLDEIRAVHDAATEIERLRGIKPELPPRPPDDGDQVLPRYGIRWNDKGEPLSVPMVDGYWTPWHLADRHAHEMSEIEKLRLAVSCAEDLLESAQPADHLEAATDEDWYAQRSDWVASYGTPTEPPTQKARDAP
jgi:hypothetical protein